MFNGERSSFWKNAEGVRKSANMIYSIGLRVRESGEIADVKTGSPAASAGIGPASKIIAVNGREFSTSLLRNSIADAEKTSGPITLLIKDGEFYSTHAVDYHGGEQYPHLERDEAKPDLISDIIRPHAGK